MTLYIEKCISTWKDLDTLFFSDSVVQYTAKDILSVNAQLASIVSASDKTVFERTPYEDVLSGTSFTHSDCLRVYEKVEKRLNRRTEIMVNLAHGETMNVAELGLSLYDLVHQTQAEDESSVCLALILARHGQFTPAHFPDLFDVIAHSVRDFTGASIAYYLCYSKFGKDYTTLAELCESHIRDNLLVEKNEPGFNLLHVSAMADNRPFAVMLGRRLVPPQMRSLLTQLDNKDRSPLFHVHSLGMLSLLLNIAESDETRKALVVQPERVKGRTVLHRVIKKNMHDIYHVLSPLVQDVSLLRDHRGQNPFMCVRSIGFYNSTKGRVDYPSLVDTNKNTFLHVLCSSKTKDAGNSALLDYVLSDNNKFLSLLSAVNTVGKTPLALAISHKMSMCVSIIAQYSASSGDHHLFSPVNSQLVPQSDGESRAFLLQLVDLVQDDNIGGLECLERCIPSAQRRRELANMPSPSTGLPCLYEARSAEMVHRLLVHWQAGTEIDKKTGMIKNPLPRQLDVMNHYVSHKRERAFVKYMRMREMDYKTWIWNSAHDLGDALFPSDTAKSIEFVNALKPIIFHVLEGESQFQKTHLPLLQQSDRREIVFRHLTHVSMLNALSVRTRSAYMHSFLDVADQSVVPVSVSEQYIVNADRLNTLVKGLAISKKTAEIIDDLDTTIVSLERTVGLFSRVAESKMMDAMATLSENIPSEAAGRVVNRVIESEKTSDNQSALFVILSRLSVVLTEKAVRNISQLNMYHLAPIVAFRSLLVSARIPVLPIAIKTSNHIFISSLLATDRQFVEESNVSLLSDKDTDTGRSVLEMAAEKNDWTLISLLLFVNDVKRKENVELRLRILDSYKQTHGETTLWSQMKELAETKYGYGA